MNEVRAAILIPAFNEAATIRPIVEACLRHCKNVLVVDDGSTDNTSAKIQDLPITILRNAINRGKDASLLRGFAHLLDHELDVVITLDADTQHNPDDIPRFLAAHQRNKRHLIIGARRINTKHAPRFRLFANRLADFFISWAAGKKIIDTQSGYRLYPADYLPMVQHNSSQTGRFVFESKVLIDAAQKNFMPLSLPIVSNYPEGARSSYYRPIRDTSRIVFMIGWQLLSRGFYIKGLWASTVKSADLYKSEKSV